MDFTNFVVLAMTRSEKIRCIEAALREVRPYLARDGGDISLSELTEEGVVRVALHGQCKTCHLKDITLSTGLEEALRRHAPFVRAVEEAS